MSETFSAGQAAFDIFAKRPRGGVLTGAVIAYALATIAIFGAFAALMWGPLTTAFAAYVDLMAAATKGEAISDPGDPRFASLMSAYFALAPAYLLVIFLVYVALAAFEAAVHRWLVRGEAGGGFLGLTLGADTWRVYFSYWIWFLIVLGLYLLCVIAMVAAIGGLAAAGLDAAIAAPIGVVVVLAVVFAFLYILLRLAPANAVSVGRKKFAFFDAWAVTRGRFWSMLGAFLILVACYMIAAAVLTGVMFGAAFGPILASVSAGGAPDPSAMLQAFANPVTLAVVALSYAALIVVGIVMYLAMLGVNARAVRVALAEGRIAAPA